MSRIKLDTSRFCARITTLTPEGFSARGTLSTGTAADGVDWMHPLDFSSGHIQNPERLW